MKPGLLFIVSLLLSCAVSAQLITTEEYPMTDEMSVGELDSAYKVFGIPGLYPKVAAPFLKGEFHPRSLVHKKLFDENLIYIGKMTNRQNSDDFLISVDPAVDFRMGSDGENSLYKNTRGFVLEGDFGQKLFVRSEFYETQTTLPLFAARWIDTMKFVPGMIRMKPFGTNGFDYGVVFSQILWTPVKNYGIRLGYDRFHIGKGYRSMILSDASQAYPFLMNSYIHGKWSLSHSLVSLHNADLNGVMDVPKSESGGYQQKWLSFTYLTFSPNKKLNVGLYESVVFMPSDSTGVSFYPMSLVPMPLVRTFVEKQKGLHHVMLALLADATIKDNISLYTQIIADGANSGDKKFQGAFQLGARWLMNRRNGYWPSWVYSEVNIATANAYTSNHSWTAYTQFDQPIAHPTGQQFVEWASGIHYTLIRPFIFDVRYNTIWSAGLPVTNLCLLPDAYGGTGFYAPQGDPDKVTHLQITIGYNINQLTNLVAFAGVHYRNFNPAYSHIPESALVYEIGIRHMIRRQNYDFF